MIRCILFVVITILFGCATPREILSSPMVDLRVSSDTADLGEAKPEYNLSVAPVLTSVLTGGRQGEIYSGASITFAFANRGINLHLIGAASRHFVGSTHIDVAALPKPLEGLIPIKNIAKLKVIKGLDYYFVTPAITIDLL